MVPADVALDDFAGTGVVHLWSVGVFDGRGQVADAGIACILHRHGAVVLGPFPSDDGIFESGVFEGFLPVVDTLNEVFAPLFRGSGVYVVDDGLLRLNEFAGFPAFQVGTVFWLQAPACDEAVLLHFLLIVREDVIAVGEIAHARIEQTAGHRIFGQQDKGEVHLQRHLSGVVGGHAVARCGVPGLGHAHLGVGGKGPDAFYIGQVGQQRAHTPGLLGALRGAEGGVVLQKERVGLDAVTSVLVGFGLKGCNDGVLVGGCDSTVDVVERVGHTEYQVAAQEQFAVFAQFPVDGLVVEQLTAVFSCISRRRDVAGCDQDGLAQECLGDFQIPVVVHLLHVE